MNNILYHVQSDGDVIMKYKDKPLWIVKTLLMLYNIIPQDLYLLLLILQIFRTIYFNN